MKRILIILIILQSISVNATTYYVSNTGSDSNSGLTGVLSWQTIAKVNSFTGFVAGDNILFKRGDTFYGSIIINKSGTSGNLITIGAYGSGNKPIITGFTTVSGGWTDLGFNVWESTDTVSSLSTLKLVLINGVNTPMGRFPNGSSTYPYLPNFYYFQSHTGTGLGSTSITSSSLTDGNNWTGAEIVVRVNLFTLDKETITGQSGTTINYDGQAETVSDGWSFFIQNDTRTLDQQGEWFYDPSTKKLRIYSTTEPTDVKVTTVDTLLYTGSRQYLSVSNLKFTGANTSAIVMPGAHYSSITGCEVDYTGDIAIDVYGTINTLNITGNAISNSGSSAIWGRGYLFDVSNNIIKNAGVVSGYKAEDYSYGAIVITSPSTPDAKHIISLNNIDSSGYCGIQFRGDSVQIKNNIINHSCLIRGDGGGIYTGFSGEEGKVIDGNIVLNSIGNRNGIKSGSGSDAHGIYIDDLGNNMTITNNTIAGCSNSGLFLHNTKNITVRNNNIYDNGGNDYTKGQIFIQNGSGTSYNSYARENVIKENTLVAKSSNQYTVFYDAANNTNLIQDYGVFDSNYYAKPVNSATPLQLNQTGTSYTIMGLPIWQSTTGQDANTIGSPKSASEDSLLFVYNFTDHDSTITLPYNYIDMQSNSYNGIITLEAYTSKTLIQNGTATGGTPPPIVNAGNDTTIYLGGQVTLNGSVESAPGHTSTYLWTVESGTGTFDDATALNPTVSSISLGTNVLRLTATQDDAQTQYGEATITVINPISQTWHLKGRVIFKNSN